MRDPRTFRSAGGKSKRVGESVLVYRTRRPSPPRTNEFNGGRERNGEERKKRNGSIAIVLAGSVESLYSISLLSMGCAIRSLLNAAGEISYYALPGG